MSGASNIGWVNPRLKVGAGISIIVALPLSEKCIGLLFWDGVWTTG